MCTIDACKADVLARFGPGEWDDDDVRCAPEHTPQTIAMLRLPGDRFVRLCSPYTTSDGPQPGWLALGAANPPLVLPCGSRAQPTQIGLNFTYDTWPAMLDRAAECATARIGFEWVDRHLRIGEQI
jgi:hypothetical protein